MGYHSGAKALHGEAHANIKMFEDPIGREKERLIEDTECDAMEIMATTFCHQQKRKAKMISARNRAFTRDHLDGQLCTISTLASTKSCVRVETPEAVKKKTEFNTQTPKRTINKHSSLQDKKAEMAEGACWTRSTKVFDELYRISADPSLSTPIEVTDTGIEPIAITVFKKGQRTVDDRIIYQGPYQTKCFLYLLERLYKQCCMDEHNEVISIRGDAKVVLMEKERRTCYSQMASDQLKYPNMEYGVIEMASDVSGFSKNDLTSKYIFMVAATINLMPNEKWKLIAFLLEFMNKKLVIPDHILKDVIDPIPGVDDMFREATNNFERNWVKMEENWGNGFLNYTASYAHAICMSELEEAIKLVQLKRGLPPCYFGNLVHSDDSTLTVYMPLKSKASRVEFGNFVLSVVTDSMKDWCFKVNPKKSYLSLVMKEFLSQVNLNGEQIGNYVRALFPATHEMNYKHYSEDITVSHSGIVTAMILGAPPSLTKLASALAHSAVEAAFSIGHNQVNDISKVFQMSREDLPTLIGGVSYAPEALQIVLGPLAHDLAKLRDVVKKANPKPAKDMAQMADLICDETIENMTDEDKKFAKALLFLRDVNILSNVALEDIHFSPKMYLKGLFKLQRHKTEPGKSLQSMKDFLDMTSPRPEYEQEEEILSKRRQGLEGLAQIVQSKMNNPFWALGPPSNNSKYREYVMTLLTDVNFRDGLGRDTPQMNYVHLIFNKRKEIIPADFIDRNFSPDRIITDDAKSHVTIKTALLLMNEKIESMTLTATDLKKIFRNCIVHQKLANYHLTLDMNTIVNSNTRPKITRLEHFSTGVRTNVVNNPPRMVLKKYLDEERFIEEGDEVSAINLLEEDIKNLHVAMDPYKIREMYRESRDAEWNDLLELHRKCRIMTFCIKFCFTHLTENKASSRVFYLKESPNAGRFFPVLKGSRVHDDYYVNYLVAHHTSAQNILKDSDPVDSELEDACMKLKAVISHVMPSIRDNITKLPVILSSWGIHGKSLREWLKIIMKRNKHLHWAVPLADLAGIGVPFSALQDLGEGNKKVLAYWTQPHTISRDAMMGDFTVTYKSANVLATFQGLNQQITTVKCEYKHGLSDPEIEGALRPILNTVFQDLRLGVKTEVVHDPASTGWCLTMNYHKSFLKITRGIGHRRLFVCDVTMIATHRLARTMKEVPFRMGQRDTPLPFMALPVQHGATGEMVTVKVPYAAPYHIEEIVEFRRVNIGPFNLISLVSDSSVAHALNGYSESIAFAAVDEMTDDNFDVCVEFSTGGELLKEDEAKSVDFQLYSSVAIKVHSAYYKHKKSMAECMKNGTFNFCRLLLAGKLNDPTQIHNENFVVPGLLTLLCDLDNMRQELGIYKYSLYRLICDICSDYRGANRKQRPLTMAVKTNSLVTLETIRQNLSKMSPGIQDKQATMEWIDRMITLCKEAMKEETGIDDELWQ